MKSRANHRLPRTLRTAAACLLTLALAQTAIGQATRQDQGNSSDNCPTISVSCPLDFDYPKPAQFKASIIGFAPEGIRYDWAVSAGTILMGQGTATIKVETSGFGGQSITGTVTIYGLSKSCPAQASCSLAIIDDPAPAFLFDRYYPKSIGAGIPKRTSRRRRSARLH